MEKLNNYEMKVIENALWAYYRGMQMNKRYTSSDLDKLLNVIKKFKAL